MVLGSTYVLFYCEKLVRPAAFVENLQGFLPTPDEMVLLNTQIEKSNELGGDFSTWAPPERMWYDVQTLPCFRERIAVWNFKFTVIFHIIV